LYAALERRLAGLASASGVAALAGNLIGIEKESLRVTPDGGISPRPHPKSLGSPLTHPYITTDYSEALLELITPPFAGPGATLDFLRDLHKFVYDRLGAETLWATSMPCIVHGAESIPIAEYGSSNAGMMKTVYRRGLGYRYGKVMQVIAGVHFNFSFSDAFWGLYQDLEGIAGDRRPFVDVSYMAMVRNLQRIGWLVPYLFGASPAVCKSFLQGRPTRLKELDAHTYYLPYATSLRMGDIGYQNSREKGVGIQASYDSLDGYIDSLTRATETACPLWEKIGVVVDGEYRQLNANILQIENEYYSSVRLKQPPGRYEKPTLALKRRGVQYVELRSLDVDAFHPLGVDQSQLRFLEALMLFCLLQDSPPVGDLERREIDQNLGGTAQRGRDPALHLRRGGRERPFRVLAAEVLGAMQWVCALLDRANGTAEYSTSLRAQVELVADPQRTPSARMLAEMREHGESFHSHAARKSAEHREYFRGQSLPPERLAGFEDGVRASLREQVELEAQDGSSFADFLALYFAQR
jgi:glutamate--cysteine ligase